MTSFELHIRRTGEKEPFPVVITTRPDQWSLAIAIRDLLRNDPRYQILLCREVVIPPKKTLRTLCVSAFNFLLRPLRALRGSFSEAK